MFALRTILPSMAAIALTAAATAAFALARIDPEMATAAPAVSSESAPETAPAESAQPPAAAPVVDPSVYQVVRAGDRAMSCDVLIAEINATNAKMAAGRMAAMDKMGSAANRMVAGTMATSAASSLLGGVASMVPMGSTIMNAAVKAKQASAMSNMTRQTMEAQKDLMSEGDVQARLDHLSRLYESKQC